MRFLQATTPPVGILVSGSRIQGDRITIGLMQVVQATSTSMHTVLPTIMSLGLSSLLTFVRMLAYMLVDVIRRQPRHETITGVEAKRDLLMRYLWIEFLRNENLRLYHPAPLALAPGGDVLDSCSLHTFTGVTKYCLLRRVRVGGKSLSCRRSQVIQGGRRVSAGGSLAYLHRGTTFNFPSVLHH